MKELQEKVNKLSDISETISELAKSYDEVAATVIEDKEDIKCENENKKIFKKELYSNIENMEDNILYDDIKNSNEIVDDIFKHLNKNKKLTKDVLILIFAKYNNYIIGTDMGNINKSVENDINKMIEVINKSYNVSKINFVWKKKLEEKNKNMSVQLQGVSEVIADLAEDIKDSKKEKYVDQKNLIKKILMQKGIVTSNIKITKNDSGRSIVNIYVENNEENPENIAKKISKVLLKVLEEKMTWQKKKR